jgi:hypothetical protein
MCNLFKKITIAKNSYWHFTENYNHLEEYKGGSVSYHCKLKYAFLWNIGTATNILLVVWFV